MLFNFIRYAPTGRHNPVSTACVPIIDLALVGSQVTVN